MSRPLTIYMFHFIRPDDEPDRFPGYGPRLADFERQLDHLQRTATVVDAAAVLDAAGSDRALPPDAVLLTFDDGYRDHLERAMPALLTRGLSGIFFPAARPLVDGRLLDVNKIQMILRAATVATMLAALSRALDDLRDVHGLQDLPAYREAWRARLSDQAMRFEDDDVVFAKQMLQKELPDPARGLIVDRLFAELAGCDERAAAAALYAGIDDIRAMREAGMTIGSHGYAHRWLDRLPDAEIADDIGAAAAFWTDAGLPEARRLFCYPYGGYTDAVSRACRESGTEAAFTTRFRVADLDTDDPLALPRLDERDIAHGDVP